MFGDILIDKFNCYLQLPADCKKEAEELKLHIENVLGKHYANNAYKVTISNRYHRLSFWFTPTRYFRTIEDMKRYTDTNLAMPAEADLKEFFDELLNNSIFNKYLPKFKITKLDLTKNFLVKEPVNQYITMLQKRLYNGRFRSLLHTSGRKKDTLSITTLANNHKKKDKVGDRELIIYDKVKELKRHKIRNVDLKEPLTNEEASQITPAFYSRDNGTLYIKYLNIIRLEWQYGSSNKLSDFSKHAGFANAEKGLFLKDFLSLLNKGELYSVLDDYYTEMFMDVAVNRQGYDKNLRIYKKIIRDYWDEVMDLPLVNAFKANGLWQEYRLDKFKMQALIENPLFEELKNKILHSNNSQRHLIK